MKTLGYWLGRLVAWLIAPLRRIRWRRFVRRRVRRVGGVLYVIDNNGCWRRAQPKRRRRR